MPAARRILILSFSPIARDPRVMRQVRLLEGRHRLAVAGYGPKPDASVDYCSLDYVSSTRRRLRRTRWELQLALGLFDRYYWSRPEVKQGLQHLAGKSFDLVLANDIPALPLGLRIAGTAPVVLDAHEYSPAEFEDRLLWRLRYGRQYTHICKTELPRVAAMTTVCEGIAEEYARQFGVRAVVVENAPPLQALAPQRAVPDRVRMIHHGAAIRSRKLELMIDTLKLADRRFTLDFMLVGNDHAYVDELKQRAAGDPRVRFLDPVPMPEICRATNGYDIGLFLLPPTNFNYRFALPNKLFEFIQARLAVVIGPSEEMARIVNRHGVGIVADSYDPADVASRLNAMSIDELNGYKSAADSAASVLCFEAVSTRLLDIIERLLPRMTVAP